MSYTKRVINRCNVIALMMLMTISTMSYASVNSDFVSYEVLCTAERDTLPRTGNENPRFPGCEDLDLSPKERSKCADEKLNSFINSNLRYPEEAKKVNAKGMVIVQFMINADGSISDEKIRRSPHPACTEEVERLLKLFPKWIPAKTRGQNSSVRYTLPIRFGM